MNTGTPLDLTPFGSVLQGIGLLYWFLVALVLATVVTRAKSRWGKWLSAAVVLGIMVGPVAWDLWKKHEAQQKAKARLDTAMALFNEHCKSAGEKIYRTVDNVEGIFLMKVRPQKSNFSDQFAMDDPYGRDLGGDAYIMSFLRDFYQSPKTPVAGAPERKGYYYVEAIDLHDGKRYRYTGSTKEVTHTSSIMMGGDGKTTFQTKDFVLDRALAPGPVPRYGVTYDDISTRQDREYWIAGSSLKVIDLQTNEIIAERIGYMIDRGQGSSAGFREPWLFAADHACPSFQRNPLRPLPPGHGSSAQPLQTIDFVEKILKPEMDN